MYNLKMAIIKRRNMKLYLMKEILHILPINTVVLDQYTHSTSLISFQLKPYPTQSDHADQ